MTEFFTPDGSLWKWEFSANTLEVYSPTNEKYIIKKNQVLSHKWWFYPTGQLYYQHKMPVYLWHQAKSTLEDVEVIQDFILLEICPHWRLKHSVLS